MHFLCSFLFDQAEELFLSIKMVKEAIDMHANYKRRLGESVTKEC